MSQRWIIDRLFDGQPALPTEQVSIAFARQTERLVVEVDAPFHDDPPPLGPPGPIDELWTFEVVELFLLAKPDHYLEIELGPHGHHLVLELHGRRTVIRSGLSIAYDARIDGLRWHGHAEVPLEYVPTAASRGNAYAIHGAAPRRYLAYYPVLGSTPDFHRLERFGSLD